MNERFYLLFGATAPRIEEQLKDRGLRINLSPLERQLLQQHADSIAFLREDGLLSPTETDRARKRLTKKVSEHLEKIPGGET